jgi:malate synthase
MRRSAARPAQAWQLVHHEAKLDDGRPETEAMIETVVAEELEGRAALSTTFVIAATNARQT